MSFLADLFNKRLAENENNIRFWEDYVQNLKSLDFSTYTDKLRVPVMVPIGSRILFRGELKHTNEITVALGADYFVKCSVKQAEVLRQHRIKDAEEKLEMFRKEREYIENQVSFKNENVFGKEGQEIIEVHSEEEDRAWRKKHRENVKKWKQKKDDDKKSQDETTEEDLWNRLEELELQEELENELMQEEKQPINNIEESFVVKEDETSLKNKDNPETQNNTDIIKNAEHESATDQTAINKPDNKVKSKNPNATKVSQELLQKVLEKQKELEGKLSHIEKVAYVRSKTEHDLIAKLDRIETLEELEDEIERLEDYIDEEIATSEEELEEDTDRTPQSQQNDTKRRVSFADEDDSETLELSFTHSDIEPCHEPYDPDKGVTKPSDVYAAFSNNFTETTSILKKSKYEDKASEIELPQVEKTAKKKVEFLEKEKEESIERKTIVVKDVMEKANVSENKTDGADKRPMSLFKQMRQQKK